jgi:hypothetical protein
MPVDGDSSGEFGVGIRLELDLVGSKVSLGSSNHIVTDI